MKLSNLRIGARLGAGFAVCVLLLAGVSAAAVVSLQAIGEDMRSVIEDRYAKVKLFYLMSDLVAQQARRSREVLLIDQPAQQRTTLEAIEADARAIEAMYERLSQAVDDDAGRQLLDALGRRRQAFTEVQQNFESTVRAGNREGAQALLVEQVLDRQKTYVESLDALIRHQEAQMDAVGADTARVVRQRTALLGAVCVLAALALVAVAVATARSITRPLKRASEVAGTVARGDLTARIAVTSTDEPGMLLRSLREMNDGLGDIVRRVRAGTELIGDASREIAQGNGDLSVRTEQQSSQLQQAAASMEQLAEMVSRNAQATAQASRTAVDTSRVAGQGGDAVAQVVRTMEEIQGASRRIEQIVVLIDGIAFRTNLLALNAAVEAARAGEQGRGFAVVAAEVRNLAQRSADAAREIKSLIRESVARVDDGTRLAAAAGTTMADVVRHVRQVESLLGEITESTAQQTADIRRVNHTVSALDQATQQNAALVEQAAAASESLREQAAGLIGVVAKFRLA